MWCCILIDAPAAGSGGEGGEEEEGETENRGGEAEQATGARREGVMKHRADTPP